MIPKPPFPPEDVGELLMALFEKHKVLPAELWVENELVFDALLPLVHALDLKLVGVESLPVASLLRDELNASCSR